MSTFLMSTFLMTGASRGIGLHAAEHLVRDDPDIRLIVVARDGQARPEHPHVRAIRGDLGSLAGVRQIAAAMQDVELSGYLGNAGVQMTSAAHATPDGFETTFGINVLAHYLLIRLIQDRFTNPARIVITGSDSHFGDFRHTIGLVPAPRWDDAGRLASPGADGATAGRRAYSTSKLGVIYLVHALARRLPAGVDAYTFNPSLVPGTGLARDAGPIARAVFAAVGPLLLHTPLANSADEAGAQLAAVATGPRPGPSGSYIDRTTLTRSSPESYDEAREEALWAAAARLTGLPA